MGRVLDAAVRLARTPDDDPAHASACRTADTAAAEAWRTLSLMPVRSPEHEALTLLLVHTESGGVGHQELVRSAQTLRTTAPLPDLMPPVTGGDRASAPLGADQGP
ncbi:hypothetical protein [Streptomyces sp. MMG1121]|uniref:hypothetical protein n=1 Tax=Streptomyces sp. MMG1121 TaxID=1415544 RepID=UPI0006AFB6CB|nr:hypothetical protein [Streptomyces sp. MMG1121]KOV58170.1 hypothetical protein ADK64_37440 [Streptomyces sp. MMG1121]